MKREIVSKVYITEDFEPTNEDSAMFCVVHFADGEKTIFRIVRDGDSSQGSTKKESESTK